MIQILFFADTNAAAVDELNSIVISSSILFFHLANTTVFSVIQMRSVMNATHCVFVMLVFDNIAPNLVVVSIQFHHQSHVYFHHHHHHHFQLNLSHYLLLHLIVVQ
eukprot:894810_1